MQEKPRKNAERGRALFVAPLGILKLGSCVFSCISIDDREPIEGEVHGIQEKELALQLLKGT